MTDKNRALQALHDENERLGLYKDVYKQEQGEQDTLAYREAASLAQWLFKKHFAHEEHYASGRVVWGLCDTTAGVISQIDNMVCKLVREQEQGEPVAWLYHDAGSLEEMLEAERKCFNLHSVLLSIRRHEAYRNETPLYTTPQQRKPQGHAGITIWGGDATVTKVFTEIEMKTARNPSELIKHAVQQCLDELATFGAEE
jgi:hypothetical protein